MKTQISRISHRPEKRYSGVYQQQGRMITDSDWNELVDIVKERLGDVLGDLIVSGIPRRNGLTIVREQQTGEIKIYPGCLYIDGIRGEIQGNLTLQTPLPTPPLPLGEMASPSLKSPLPPGERGQPIGFDEQPDFPLPPGTGPAVGDIIYADLWERPVISLEALDLLDPGLHGADTCTRTQTMVQLKWCTPPQNPADPPRDPEVPDQNPPKGDATLSVELRSEDTPTATEAETAINEAAGDRIGNYLFRLEVHAVDDPVNPQTITLKWSSENAAEAFAYAGIEALPPGFVSRDWVYEFYTDTSERYLGVHLASGVKQVLAALVPPNEHGNLTIPAKIGDDAPQYVRRWDGYCVLERQGDAWALAKRDINGTETPDGTDRGIPLSPFDASAGNTAPPLGSVRFFSENGLAKVTIHLAQLALTLTLSETVEGVLEPRHFVLGDYWLSVVRENAPLDERASLLSEEPLGIKHHYLTLPVVEDRDDWAFASSEDLRKFCFHSLTDMSADRIGYDPSILSDWWKDVQETDDDDPQYPDTVQKAIDAIAQLDTTDIPISEHRDLPQILQDPKIITAHDALYRLAEFQGISACAYVGVAPYLTISDVFELKPGTEFAKKDFALCLLNGHHPIERGFAPPATHSIKITGTSAHSTSVQAQGHLTLEAEEIILRDLSFLLEKTLTLRAKQILLRDVRFQVPGRSQSIVLEAERVTGQDCAFEQLETVDNYVWARTFGNTGSSVEAQAIAVAPDGSLRVTGAVQGNPSLCGDDPSRRPGKSDLFVLSASPSGEPLWSACSRLPAGSSDQSSIAQGTAVAVDTEGNVLLTGFFSGEVDLGCGLLDGQGNKELVLKSPEVTDLFVLQLQPESAENKAYRRGWLKNSSYVSPGSWIKGLDIAVDGSGNVLVMGTFYGSVYIEDPGTDVNAEFDTEGESGLFVLKYSPQGDLLWWYQASEYDDQASGDDGSVQGSAAALDAAGDVWVTGSFTGTVDFGGEPLSAAGKKSLFVLKLRSEKPESGDQHPVWLMHSDDAGNGTSATQGAGIVVDKDGNGVVAGVFSGEVDFGASRLVSAGVQELFLLKLEPDAGATQWSMCSQGIKPPTSLPTAGEPKSDDPLGSYISNIGVDTDEDRSLFVTGSFTLTVDFGGGPLQATGAKDAFVLKLDPSGAHHWVRSFGAQGGTVEARGMVSVVPGPTEDPYVVAMGSFDGKADLGGGEVDSAGQKDLYLLKLHSLDLPRPLVLVKPSQGQAAELDWVGNRMRTIHLGGNALDSGRFLLRSRETTLALATHTVSGLIENNHIEGRLALMHEQGTSLDSRSGIFPRPALQDSGAALQLKGNRIDRIVTNGLAEWVLGEWKGTKAYAYAALLATGNIFTATENSLIGRALTLNDNQFSGSDKDTAVGATLVGESGVFTGNQATNPAALVLNNLKNRETAANRLTVAFRVFRDVLADGSQGPAMIWIPPGTFRMGDLQGVGASQEKPVHTVSIAQSFAIGKYPVTFGEYDKFARDTGQDLPGDTDWGRGKRPVINVSWDNARAYCDWLKEQTGKVYRLPTEAEWEYVARAGSQTRYFFGDNESNLGTYAWYSSNAEGETTHPVGEKEPNPWGLYDVYGNVYEWVKDCWHSDYEDAPHDGTEWLDQDSGDCARRVVRGGSWYNFPWGLRSANRDGHIADIPDYGIGFRLAQDL